MTTADAAARAARRTRCAGCRGRCPPASATCGRARSSRRARARRTSSTRPGCSAARALGALLAGTPIVLKLTADPAYERARRCGLSGRRARGLPARARPRASRRCGDARRDVLRRARTSSCPSAYLRELAVGWGVAAGPDRRCCRTRRRAARARPTRRAARASTASTGRRSSFAGRLTRQKALDVALEARRGVHGVALVIAGDGARARAARARRARADRALPRRAAARRRCSSCSAPPTPCCSRRVGELPARGRRGARGRDAGDRDRASAASPRSSRDGENGLLVAPGDAGALAAAIRRFFADAGSRARLRGARRRRRSPTTRAERVYGRIEEILLEAARGEPTRLLMVGRTRYALPLEREPARASSTRSSERFDLRVLASGAPGAATRRRFELVRPCRPRTLDGPRFYFARCRSASRGSCARSGRTRSLVQGAHETWLVLLGRRARALARAGRPRRARRLARLHAAVRLAARGGCSARSPTGSPRSALRHADAVRTISDYTTALVRAYGVEPAAVFPAYMDLEPFLGAGRAAARRAARRSSSACSSTTRGRGARGRLARRRRAALPGRDAAPRRHGHAARASSSSSSRDLPDASSGRESLPSRGRRRRARRGDRACCCRRAPRAWAACSSRRSAAAGRCVGVARRRHRRPRPRRRERSARPAAGPAGARRRDRPACSPTPRSPSGSAPARARAPRRGWRRRRSTRRGWKRSSPDYDRSMRADRIKQSLKNSVYRALGETATGVGAVERSLLLEARAYN